MWGSLFSFLKHLHMDHMVKCFCDKNASQMDGKFDVPVLPFAKVKEEHLPFLVAVSQNNPAHVAIIRTLEDNCCKYYIDLADLCLHYFQMDKVRFYREYCAWHHLDNMDWYYASAEGEESLNGFWGRQSPFYSLFMQLDLSNVVELACGRGRHVPKYLPRAGHVTLVDILEKNIDFVKERFKDFDNISYYVNNGSDLSELPDDSYTSLFTYDAMVHFELMDVMKYLEETYRVLRSGGMALFHHSNNHADYKISFTNGFSGRNYMSKEIFAYFAYREGFEIIEQQTIDWENVPDLDCITLVKKG